MLIRRAGIEDLDRLRGVVRTCFPDSWGEGALVGSLRDPAARVWLAEGAENADTPALGFILARRILDLVEIDLVGVDPGARRGGVARRLLAQLLEVERAAGGVEARLELSAANAAAAALYAGLGFVVVGRRPRYYPDGGDALLLTRSLV